VLSGGKNQTFVMPVWERKTSAQKNSCIAGPGVYDGAHLGQTFLMRNFNMFHLFLLRL
jgi:hypothetical protein